jgi:hypothetical protein
MVGMSRSVANSQVRTAGACNAKFRMCKFKLKCRNIVTLQLCHKLSFSSRLILFYLYEIKL